MARIDEQFIGKYSLQKTIRFELRPVGATTKLLREFKNQTEGNLLEKDAERARAYEDVKIILDEYHRFFIEEVLSNFEFDHELIEAAYRLYEKKKTDADCLAQYQVITAAMRKEIASALAHSCKDYMIDKYEKLFKADGSMLYTWLGSRRISGEISEDEYNSCIELLGKFKDFTAYFKEYRNNRNNLFSDEEKATAISYRVVNENMPRFFENCIRVKAIEKNHPLLFKSLKKHHRKFAPSMYAGMVSQRSITEYNRIIGSPDLASSQKGINSIINEYRQKKGIRNRDLPLMSQLYKQLLSDRIVIYNQRQISDDSEMIQVVAGAAQITLEASEKLTELIKEYVVAERSNRIFIDCARITELSQRIFGQWDFINRAVNAHKNGMSSRDKKNLEARLKSAVAMVELQGFIDQYIRSLDKELRPDSQQITDLCKYFQISPLAELKAAVVSFETSLPDSAYRKELISNVKTVMDCIMEIVHFYRPLYLFKEGKALQIINRDDDFYAEFERLYNDLESLFRIYNSVRNYATKKPFSNDKIKLCFDRPTLLDGWDMNKEKTNLCAILLREGTYYLAIMNRDHNNVFDLNRNEINELANKSNSGSYYSKMEYKQLQKAFLNIPRILFSESKQQLFAPSKDILHIKKNKLYTKEAGNKKALEEWIDFCKGCIANHPEWNRYFKFTFKESSQYADVNEFYSDFDRQAYNINFVDISADYVDTLVDEGKLYLFQIYNKDFSAHSNGKPNLHTSYWRMLFDEENLRNITKDNRRPVFKLNGEAEIFYRQASLEKQITHIKGQPIMNKNPNNPKRESMFDIDLIKDRRYTEDKLFFHCPITINFRARTTKIGAFNLDVNRFVEGNPDINVIGIDRGERHLLYYTVINQRGEILEQGSLNRINNTYVSGGQTIERDTNYRELLHDLEERRGEARKNWDEILNIKEMKTGYLSQVVHKVSRLMIDYNAILVLEDLNAGFKRSRIKFEKQVYQKFEKAMIDKTNYLVFKDAQPGSPGHYLNGYQLTAPFERFRDLGRQSGFLYYVFPSYTSHICPKTGFVKRLSTKYEGIKQAQSFFGKFDRISYNSNEDFFEFHFDYKKFGVEMYRNKWIVCTHGNQRYFYDPRTRKNDIVNVTEEMKVLLSGAGIDYETGTDLLPMICAHKVKDFLSRLLFLLGLTLQMRYTIGGTGNDDDYILSPVKHDDGTFFDSRRAGQYEPRNADANGAYHIALKGLKIISGVSQGELSRVDKKETEAWFKYVQKKEYRQYE